MGQAENVPLIKRTLYVVRADYDSILAHCQQASPKEACGLLAGSRVLAPGQPDRLVAQVYRMTNVENTAIGYSMDPREQLRVEKIMRQGNQYLLGIYHSHTATEAFPSPVDVSLALSPELSYVLVSLKDKTQPVLNSYRIDGQTVEREQVVVEDKPSGARRIATG